MLKDFMKKIYKKGPWNRAVTAVGAVIVFVTTYMLILPAITLSTDPQCGLEEHIHTQECYTTPYYRALQCNLDAGSAIVLHTHDANCYDEAGNLVCTLPEIQEHVHTAECYADDGAALFSDGMTSSEEALTLLDTLEDDFTDGSAFTSEESDLFEDGSALEDQESAQPICGKDQLAPHVHDDTCFDEYGNLTCGLLEVIAHQHDDSCFALLPGEPALTCGKEEHIHSEDCYQRGLPQAFRNIFSDEKPQEAQIADEAENPSPENPQNLFSGEIQAAQDQNQVLEAEDKLSKERTDFIPETETTVEPATEATTEAGVEMPEEAAETTESFEEPTTETSTTETPTPEMTVEESTLLETEAQAPEMSAETPAETGTENPAEATTSGAATKQTTETAAEETTAEVSTELTTETATELTTEALTTTTVEETTELTTEVIRYEGIDYSVCLTYDDNSGIPADSTVSALEIPQDSEEYQEYLVQAKLALNLDDDTDLPKEYARFFDITIWHKNEAGEEEEIEPTGPVTVEIRYKDPVTPGEAEANVVHFDAEKNAQVVETLDPAAASETSADSTTPAPVIIEMPGTGEESALAEETETTTFEATSFSVYGVIYTVDFHYEVNGKMYEFSIPGGGFVSLEYVVEVLGIASADENSESRAENAEIVSENEGTFVGEVSDVDEGDENGTVYEEAVKLNEVEVSESTKKFVADVESVEFSTPSLVDVSKVETETTVGGIKESRGLEVEYSADLTEEQIAEINAQTVEAGDWVLISVRPFTSEETLTVTMKNGNVWTIRVTDAQSKTLTVAISPAGWGGVRRDGTYNTTSKATWTTSNDIKFDVRTINWDRYYTVQNNKPATTYFQYLFAGWTVNNHFYSNYVLANGSDYAISPFVDDNIPSGAMIVAHFYPKSAKVVLFDTEDGTNTMGSVSSNVYFFGSSEDGNAANVMPTASAASGYQFKGWYDGETLVSNSPTPTTNELNGLTSGTVLRAKFEEITDSGISITYNVNDANAGIVANSDTNQGTSITSSVKTTGEATNSAYPKANSGYRFVYWVSNDAVYDTYVEGTTAYKIKPTVEADTTFTAYFAPDNQYLIRYLTDGNGAVDKAYSYSGQIGATASPTDGYAFRGWYDENGKIVSIKPTFPAETVSKDLTVTAKFVSPQKVKHTLAVSSTEAGDIVHTTDGVDVSQLGTKWADDGGKVHMTYTAKANEGYKFDHWELNGERIDVESETISKANSPVFQADDVLTAVFRQLGAQPYTIAISDTEGNAVGGDVTITTGGNSVSHLGKHSTDSEGYLNNTITARPADDYEFSHWELNGVKLDPEEYEGFKYATLYSHDEHLIISANDELTAVFYKPVKVEAGEGKNGNIISDAEKKELDAWLKSLDSSDTLNNVSKTSQVYDYENRIYEVDFNAESGIRNLLSTIDLGFILDVSASMKFPSKLEKVQKDGKDLSIVLTQENLKREFPAGGTYYIISAPSGSATVYKIFKEGEEWRFKDASVDGDGTEITGSEQYKEGASGNSYEIYYDAKVGNRRLDDLNNSMASGVDAMKSIMASETRNGSSSYIRVAYNTFARNIYHQLLNQSGQKVGSYDSNFQFSDFTNIANDSNYKVDVVYTQSGTRQDLGLWEATNYFTWGSNNQKYAILITDGAPVVSETNPDYSDKNGYCGNTLVPTDSSWNNDKKAEFRIAAIKENIQAQAAALKAKDVTLITIGLSTKNVTDGSALLDGLADSIDGVKQFYEAESGDDLKYILLKILQTIMARGDVSGQASDAVDPAYYPVQPDGTPIKAGYYYDADKDGNAEWHETVPANSSDAYYEWINNNGNWTIKWYNQNIGWAQDGNAWSPKIYVKAKENFLGGNAVTTNGEASITPESYRLRTKDGYTDPVTINENPTTIPTPTVNVKELSLNGHDATWTLYLGSEVTDDEVKKQISNLFDAIDVKELVTEEGKPIVSASDEPATFLLKDLIGGSLTETELTNLLEGKTVTRQYDHYGHTDVGKVTITLQKETNADGDTVYKLAAEYAADQSSKPGSNEDWHNGSNGPGRAMKPITSDNTQTIEDYYLPQVIRIKKTDGIGNLITDSPALFKVYRKAKDEDPGTAVPLDRYDPENKDPDLHNNQFTAIETVHTRNGLASIGGLLDEFGTEKDESLLLNGADGPYYLIESGAPVGYSRTRTPVKIEVIPGPNIYTYTDSQGQQVTQVDGDAPQAIYNMTQGVTIKINNQQVAVVDGNGNQVLNDDNQPKAYLVKGDSEVYYQTTVVNTPIKADTSVNQGQILPHKKTIDYLGDAQDNPDTTADDNVSGSEEKKNAINDLYRLYLDGKLFNTVTNANIILVEDSSASMGTKTVDDKSWHEVICDVLTGDENKIGLVDKLLAKDSGNQMSMISFSDLYGSSVRIDWTGDVQTAKNGINSAAAPNGQSTNYERAFQLIDAQIASIPESRKSDPTYVIFISDGLPTAYMNNLGNEVTAFDNMVNIPGGLTQSDIYGKENVENLNWVLGTSVDAVNSFKNGKSNIQICTIGLGERMSQTMTEETVGHSNPSTGAQFYYSGKTYDFILRDLASAASDGSSKLYRQAVNTIQLQEALDAFIGTPNIQNVVISDELSDYVSLYTNQLDLSVTKTTLDGTQTKLTVAYDSDRKNYQVKENDAEIGRVTLNGKTISLALKPDLTYSTGTTYTLSFNVEATTKAYEDYAANNGGYGSDTGDDGTDYVSLMENGEAAYTNATSASQPGFHSNQTATLEYTYKGTKTTGTYSNPVIQVGDTRLEIQKTWVPEIPDGVDTVPVKVFKDSTLLTTVELKRSEDWKAVIDHLVPKKLADTETDSDVHAADGTLLKKTEYVPIAYTLEEVQNPEDDTIAGILADYEPFYEFTATESADHSSFTNITARYDASNKKLVYYIPAKGTVQESNQGKAEVANIHKQKIEIAKIDETSRNGQTQTMISGASFRLLKYNGSSYVAYDTRYGAEDGVPVGSTGDEVGKLVFDHLPSGEYQIVEVHTPAGYIKTANNDIYFQIEKGVVKRFDKSASDAARQEIPTVVNGENDTKISNVVIDISYVVDADHSKSTFTVGNTPGAALPNTGGPGTSPLYLLGSMMLALGSVGLAMRRRKRAA